jgi:LuxR family maltose regulon positive regulatory protein
LNEQALERAVDGQGRRLPIAGIALMGLGELLREWNDLEAATRYLQEGIELTKQWGEIGALGGYVSIARVKQAQGDIDSAREAIQTAKRLATQFDASDMDDVTVLAYQARLLLAQRNMEGVARWVQDRGLEREIDPDGWEGAIEQALGFFGVREIEYSTLARVRIAQGRPNEALAVLKPALEIAERMGRVGSVIEFLILQALAAQSQGDETGAIRSLERALALAEPEGYVRIFVDEGEPMARLLRQAVARGIAPSYVNKLLAAFGAPVSPPSQPPPQSAQALMEPLTERELEVLRFLTTHLSSTEIAEELFISVNTVRYHIKNIYGKLDVHRRTDAIQRSRELGLL